MRTTCRTSGIVILLGVVLSGCGAPPDGKSEPSGKEEQRAESKSPAVSSEFEQAGGEPQEPPKPKQVVVKVVKPAPGTGKLDPHTDRILYQPPPPIDQIDVELSEKTELAYRTGRGESGFGEGTAPGKVHFVRIRHSDRSWDKNFGIGGDHNMLVEFGLRTNMKVADESEALEIAVLSKFENKKAPPLVYIGGAQTFTLSASEKKILKQYLIDQHGMILGDNLGGKGFHDKFVAAMNEITGVPSVSIARDDTIHQRPYALPQFPIVAAHGGTNPLGWKIDGRWVVYYHPGALSDAWRDDHAGIKKEIWENCFQLGVNVFYYALREKNMWIRGKQPDPIEQGAKSGTDDPLKKILKKETSPLEELLGETAPQKDAPTSDPFKGKPSVPKKERPSANPLDKKESIDDLLK